MGNERRGIGRGLSAILPAGGDDGPELRELRVELIEPSPDQPRTRFDEEALAALAESIRASGVVQPLLVRPRPGGSYQLIAGERRWRAARIAGLERVPAVIRSDGDAERLQTALIENMVREDLNPVEEARACAALVEDLGVTKEELARRVGRSRPAISNLIRLLDLPDDALALLESGELSEGHGRALLAIRSNQARRDLAKAAAARGWSVRETERRVKLASQPNEGRGSGRRNSRSERRIDPELETALTEAADLLEQALGREVKVRVAGDRIRAEIEFADVAELLAAARRAESRRAA